MPADWQGIRDRWEYYHTIRTVASLSAVAFFLIALLNRKEMA